MPAPQGVCRFPGVAAVKSATLTFSTGVTPSTCLIECQPQATPVARGGTLEFAFGGTVLRFPDCRVVQGSLRRDASGYVVALTVEDRRWKWKVGGEISGSYNIFRPDGVTYNRFQLRTPRQLASACLLEMGETSYDVGELPDDTLPTVEWDHDNPAQMLDALCQELGCVVVLRLDNTVKVCRRGAGAALPADGVSQGQLVIDPPERPDGLKAVCGPTLYQADFVLEPVAEDLLTAEEQLLGRREGKVKPLEDLSYKPSGGWGAEPLDFTNVKAQFSERAQKLAERDVWKKYRLRNANPWDPAPWDRTKEATPLEVPGYGPITFRDQVELEETQVAREENEVGDVLDRSAAILFGVFFDGSITFKNNTTSATPTWDNTKPETFYKGGFRVNREKRLVELDEPLFMYDADGLAASPPTFTKQPAKILLRAACTVRDPLTRAPVRFSRALPYAEQWGAGYRVLKHDEIQLQRIPTYDRSTYRVVQVEDNAAEIVPQLDYYLQAADLEYQVQTPLTLTYQGLRAIDPDGAVQQVTWSVGSPLATTTASRNTEHSLLVPTIRQRRLQAKLSLDLLRDLQKAARRRRDVR